MFKMRLFVCERCYMILMVKNGESLTCLACGSPMTDWGKKLVQQNLETASAVERLIRETAP